MSKHVRPWTVRLSATAEADFEHIIHWTSKPFGDAQAIAYAETLSPGIAALSEGPKVSGVKARDEILKGLNSLHVARQGRKGRHFIMFRVSPDNSDNVIDVLRLLHDSMDLVRHLETGEE